MWLYYRIRSRAQQKAQKNAGRATRGPRYARGRYAAGALRARDGPQGTVGSLIPCQVLTLDTVRMQLFTVSVHKVYSQSALVYVRGPRE